MNQSINDEGVFRTVHTCKFDVVFKNIMIDDFLDILVLWKKG